MFKEKLIKYWLRSIYIFICDTINTKVVFVTLFLKNTFCLKTNSTPHPSRFIEFHHLFFSNYYTTTSNTHGIYILWLPNKIAHIKIIIALDSNFSILSILQNRSQLHISIIKILKISQDSMTERFPILTFKDV